MEPIDRGPRLAPERRALQAMYGPLTADRVVGMMLGNPSAWDAVRSYADDADVQN